MKKDLESPLRKFNGIGIKSIDIDYGVAHLRYFFYKS